MRPFSQGHHGFMGPLAALLAAASLLASCANRPETLATPPPAKSIAIVASVPPQIRIGTKAAIIENTLDIVDVPEWHLDDVAANAATEVLSTRYKVNRATLNGWVFDDDSKLDKAVNQTWSIEDEVRTHAHVDNPVDLYLVITRSNTADPYLGDYQKGFIGVGISKWWNIFTTMPPLAHTYLQMTVSDGKTFKVIASTTLEDAPRKTGAFNLFEVSAPTEELEGFEWKDYWHEMTEAQHTFVHDHIVNLLRRSIIYTVKKMKLVS